MSDSMKPLHHQYPKLSPSLKQTSPMDWKRCISRDEQHQSGRIILPNPAHNTPRTDIIPRSTLSRLSRPLRLQLLRDPRRFMREVLPKNLQLACHLVRGAVAAVQTVRFGLAPLHVMDELAVSYQQLAVLPPPHLLRTPIFDKSQEPAGLLGTVAPPLSLSWKITMPRPPALKRLLQLPSRPPVEQADPCVQDLLELSQRGENQVKIEGASSVCRQHYEVSARMSRIKSDNRPRVARGVNPGLIAFRTPRLFRLVPRHEPLHPSTHVVDLLSPPAVDLRFRLGWSMIVYVMGEL